MTFEAGSFTSGLLTGLREGVEAALIVAIVLTYLARTGNGRFAPRIWVGVSAAILASLVLGGLVFATTGGLQAPYEQIFEGLTMIVAASVVTWMLFWMRRQAASVRGQLHAAIDRAVGDGGSWGLTILAFTSVIREGIETALFLVGQAQAAAVGSATGAISVLAGALAGLVVAAVLGYGFYRGTRRIDLRRFFRWTGLVLVFIAAGLVARAIHEFVEIGAIPVGTAIAFDISGVLPHEAGVGQFLNALFGYTSQPEVVALAVWAGYVMVVLTLFLRPTRPAVVAPRSVGEVASP